MTHEQDVRKMFDIIKRPGFNNLVKWLESETDYFTAPSSTKFHNAYEGGLVEHSWNVTDLLFKKNDQYSLCYDYDTLAICGLFHDLCKVNYFKLDTEEPTDAQMNYLIKLCKGKLPIFPGPLNKDYVSKIINFYKNGGEKPEYSPGSYVIDDKFPLGHGEKSVILLQQFIKLTKEEMFAIRWHMGPFDTGVHFNYPSGFAFQAAIERSPLVTILFTADFEATNLIERRP